MRVKWYNTKDVNQTNLFRAIDYQGKSDNFGDLVEIHYGNGSYTVYI